MSGENKTAASLRAEMEKKPQERDEERRRQEAEDVRMLQELEEKERMEQEELQRQAAALRKAEAEAEAEAKRKASEQRLSQSPVKAMMGSINGYPCFSLILSICTTVRWSCIKGNECATEPGTFVS